MLGTHDCDEVKDFPGEFGVLKLATREDEMLKARGLCRS
jgi:hypothetical protein